MNETTLTTTHSAGDDWTSIQVQPSIDYVQVQPQSYIQPNGYYPQPWGGWWPYPNYPYQPWVGIPYYPQTVTQQIVIPRGLTDEEIDRIADKVAEKLRAKPKR